MNIVKLPTLTRSNWKVHPSEILHQQSQAEIAPGSSYTLVFSNIFPYCFSLNLLWENIVCFT